MNYPAGYCLYLERRHVSHAARANPEAVWITAFSLSQSQVSTRLRSLQMRTFIRQPTRLPVEITAVDDPIESCQLLDIGLGGFCCKTDHTIPEGTRVGLLLPSRNRELHAQGEVSWCRRSGDDIRIGVQFLTADPESRLQLLERICDIERQRRLGRSAEEDPPADKHPPAKPAH